MPSNLNFRGGARGGHGGDGSSKKKNKRSDDVEEEGWKTAPAYDEEAKFLPIPADVEAGFNRSVLAVSAPASQTEVPAVAAASPAPKSSFQSMLDASRAKQNQVTDTTPSAQQNNANNNTTINGRLRKLRTHNAAPLTTPAEARVDPDPREANAGDTP